MVVILSNEVTPGLTGLVKKVDAFVKDNKKADAKAFLVLMTKETDEAAKSKLKDVAKENKIEIPLTINADAGTVKKLKLNEKVKNTVLVYKNTKVAANFALNEITEKDIEAIVAAAKETVGSS